VAQELGFSPAAFPFRIDVRDNGKGKAGGWQKTSPVLSFADTREVFSPKYWNCAITVGPRDMSLHIQGGDQSSAYDGKLYLPTLQPAEGMHELGFHVSFIAPCYMIYSSRWFFLDDDPKGRKASPRDLRLDFDETEQPYVQGLAQEIEAAYGYERLPPEIGRLIVPDVAMYCRVAGTATIYDCLLSPDWGR